MTVPPPPSAEPDTLASWLRCPVCAEPLEAVERLALGCTTGHRFDVNKRGYVTLLPGGTKFIGDSTAMLDARDTVLEGGVFAPVAAAIASAARGQRIVDAGAGTGYYLRATMGAHLGSRGLALDLSPAAVARAVRSSPSIVGVVADTWRPLPVRTGCCDTVLDVFAPRNLPEFHRILRRDGRLVVVVPRPDHLIELRADGGMLDVPADKAEDVIVSAQPLFSLLEREHLTHQLWLDTAIRSALVAMGPSAHHAMDTSVSATSATVSVDVLVFQAAAA
ncbi:putative RNA methyltransferase [Leifsonia poae]|uniref:putative RNA methyltransferase n=1 Tax=Leifsonia poae TaxID=110933 RepID=UPI001CBDE90D|nr:methyltransferase domain-containing protein [Leifsonia poae]